MAFASTVTIGTGNKISQSYQSQDISVSITYELERGDTDLLAFMEEKAVEVEACHSTIWRGIIEIRSDKGIHECGADDTAGQDPLPRTERALEQPKRTRAAKGTQKPAGNPTGNGTASPVTAEQPEGAIPNGFAPADPAANALPNGDTFAHEPASYVQKVAIRHVAHKNGYDPQSLGQLLTECYGKAVLEDLTRPEAAELLLALQQGDPAKPRLAA